MSAQEIIQVFDTDGNSMGIMTREAAEDSNHVIPNVLVFIFDSAGRVWIQLRPKTKKHFPGMWDISACGGIKHDETPAEAAMREQSEEMGFTSDLIFVETFMNEFPGDSNLTFTRLSHLFIGVSDDQPKTNDEVDEFKAFHHEHLRTEVEAHPDRYIPSFLEELDKAVTAYKQLAT